MKCLTLTTAAICVAWPATARSEGDIEIDGSHEPGILVLHLSREREDISTFDEYYCQIPVDNPGRYRLEALVFDVPMRWVDTYSSLDTTVVLTLAHWSSSPVTRCSSDFKHI